MRETREDILRKYPVFFNRKDLVAIWYADVPERHYGQKEHEQWESLKDEHIQRICLSDEWIWRICGDYDIYKTWIGNVIIDIKGKVLCGDVNVPYRGKTITVVINQIYPGLGKCLTILDLNGGEHVKGFCTKNGLGSPAIKRYTEEMDTDKIFKLLNNPMSDYGIGIQKFMETARSIYNENSRNYIMNHTFD